MLSKHGTNKAKQPLQGVHLNAATMDNVDDIYRSIAAKVTQKNYPSKGNIISTLNTTFTTQDVVTLLVLDGIDAWTHHSKSSLILVSIVNSVDVAEKFVAYLQCREWNPLSLDFHPYGYDALIDILKQRIVGNTLVETLAMD
ncbi:Aste57867_13036 [Aphanomyces stellatus]|uniref:Aste57867_13036 protein n=1 Tax=Aphanomyces stellatus TaxID=120398 RepID=A0A485KX46_9STRA|nr:hypothetical protein As57867_012988 [Aphanomyces stellatus]VFT89881.1 Aste57867_13036 [Aphanomyces stellatus]